MWAHTRVLIVSPQKKEYRMKKTAISILAASLLFLSPAAASATETTGCEEQTLTILATTDLHGTALNYDYFTGKPFTDAKADQRNRTRGLELLAPAIADVRTEKGKDSVVLLDNGDANQGSPLNIVYHADRTADSVDPIASVFNYLGYDAGVVGNHEFNYGHLDKDGVKGDLNQYRDSLNMPLLGANVIDKASGKPYLTSYTMIDKKVAGKDVKVGVIGVVTPGVRIWDRNSTQDLQFQDAVEAVKAWVPTVREAGADVVVVLAHTGMDAKGYAWNPADLTENVAASIATQTEGVDVVVAGHSHVTDNAETFLTNAAGKSVLVTQPGYHARSVSKVEVPIAFDGEEPTVVNTETCKASASPLYASNYLGREDAGVREAVEPWHSKTVAWVSTVVAQATDDMTAERARYEDTPIVDFINLVQRETVAKALEGTQYAGIPVLSQASPFSASARFTKGDVTIADMAGLYTFDNTLLGVEMTGAQIKDYLEWSARYYAQQPEGATIEDWSTVINALYEGQTRGIPDYSYDMLAGVNYHINISKPVGERIEGLSYPDGRAVGDEDRFILAVNNYRQSGGSFYPHVSTAKVVYDEQQAIRELMIAWGEEHGVIDPAKIFTLNWTVSTSSASAPGINPGGEDGEGGEPGPTPGQEPGGSDKAPSGGERPDASQPAPDQQQNTRQKLPMTGASVQVIAMVAGALLVGGVALRRRCA